MRLVDSCITQLKAPGPSRTCNESKEEEEEDKHTETLGAKVVVLIGDSEAEKVPPFSQ